jgi:hypothetical protein
MTRYHAPYVCLIALAAGSASADPDGIFDGFVVPQSDTVSVRMFALRSIADQMPIFTTPSGNPASIQIDEAGAPQFAGDSTAGNYDVLIGWDEFFDVEPNDPNDGIPSKVRFDISTSNGGPFVSGDDFDAGFQFIRWEIGDHNSAGDAPFADPIAFKPTVTDVVLVEATVVFFEDQMALNVIEYGFTLGVGSTWDGTDALPLNIFSLDGNANRIVITYEYTPIPAPAGLAVLAGGGLLLGRRRRA